MSAQDGAVGFIVLNGSGYVLQLGHYDDTPAAGVLLSGGKATVFETRAQAEGAITRSARHAAERGFSWRTGEYRIRPLILRSNSHESEVTPIAAAEERLAVIRTRHEMEAEYHTDQTAAHFDRGWLLVHADSQAAEIERLREARTEHIAMLAECFRLSGADCDGDEDWRIAPRAVEAVRELRTDYDEACEANDKAMRALAAERDRLREALAPFAAFACNEPHGDEPECHNCRAKRLLEAL